MHGRGGDIWLLVPPRRRVARDTGTDAVRGILLVNICFFLLTVGDVATIIALPVAGVVGRDARARPIGAATVAVMAAQPRRGRRPRRGLRRLRPVRWRPGDARAASSMPAATLTWYIAWQHGMALADSYALATRRRC